MGGDRGGDPHSLELRNSMSLSVPPDKSSSVLGGHTGAP